MSIDDDGEEQQEDGAGREHKKAMWIVKVMHYRDRLRQLETKKHSMRVKAIGLGRKSKNNSSNNSSGSSASNAEENRLIDQEQRRIADEVALHADPRFSHENIAAAVRAEQVSDGHGYLVFHDDGCIDLFEYMRKNAQQYIDAKLVCAPICAALAFLHSTFHLVHNDVKPENILIQPRNGHCLLADFGGATPASSKTGYELVTATKFFVAPERLRGEPFDERADSWSLGMLCCEVLYHNNKRLTATAVPASAIAVAAAKRINPFEQIYTDERWRRLMMQFFSEPLTESIWRNLLCPNREGSRENSGWEEMFLQKTLRIRPESRERAANLF